jgi:hypothetical protein
VRGEFRDPVTQKIADFIVDIGLELVREPIDEETFLPGILIRNGAMVVDEGRLNYPGDLLHEAGHLALSPAEIRPTLSGEVALPEPAWSRSKRKRWPGPTRRPFSSGSVRK